MQEEASISPWLAPPIVMALVVGTWLGIWALLGSRGGPPHGVVRYSVGNKIFTVVLTFLPLSLTSFALATSENLKPDDRGSIKLIMGFFLVLGVPRLVECFGVRHTFDGQELRYRTPWRWGLVLRWAEVTEIRWRPKWANVLLRDAHGTTFRISTGMEGLSELAQTALQNIPPQVLEASPDGKNGLQRMLGG